MNTTNNTIQLYVDKEKKVKAYPITSTDRVVDEKGISIKEHLLNNVKFDVVGRGDSVPEIDGVPGIGGSTGVTDLRNQIRILKEEIKDARNGEETLGIIIRKIIGQIGDNNTNPENIGNNLKIVNTTEEMENILNPREGILCYVVQDGIYYSRTNGAWEPFGVKRVTPTYTEPSLNLTSSVGLKVEQGKSINPTISAEFIQHDAGELQTYKLFKNDEVVKEPSSSIEDYTAEEEFILTENVKYKAEVSYAQGPVLKDNLNKPYPEGQIEAGTIEKEITINAVRAFWGYASDSPNKPTASEIRKMEVTGIDLQPGATITAVAQESSRTIVFAYPAKLGECTRIRYEEFGDNENKTAFQHEIVSINDASNNDPVPYRLYYYTAPDTFDATATFILTI